MELFDRQAHQWFKSSFSSAQCVETAAAGAHIALRDSKNPDGLVLLCSAQNWSAFLVDVRRDSATPSDV